MRWESLVVGLVAVVLGVYLVSTHGVIAGQNLPALFGLPCGGGSSSTSSSSCVGFGGYGIGSIVVLFGFGLVGNGLRSPPSRPSSGSMPPEMMAAFQASLAQRSMVAPRSCASCGAPNSAEALYCQKCARPMSPPAAPSAAPPTPSAPTSPPPTTPPPAG